MSTNTKTQQLSPVLTADEVADLLRIECKNRKRSVDRLRRMGHLPAVQIAGRWRYRSSDVFAYLNRK